MQKFLSILGYYQNYWRITIFNAALISFFQIIDLFIPYATGQILNIISQQSIDSALQRAVDWVAIALIQPPTPQFSLWTLAASIGLVSIILSPLQPLIGGWYSWDTAFRARRENAEAALRKIHTLPLEFYDENNT